MNFVLLFRMRRDWHSGVYSVRQRGLRQESLQRQGMSHSSFPASQAALPL